MFQFSEVLQDFTAFCEWSREEKYGCNINAKRYYQEKRINQCTDHEEAQAIS